MSQLTDMLMIGLVLVGGYYLLASGALGTGTGTTTGTSLAPVPTSTTVNVPFDQVATLWETPELREQECANWRTSDEDPRYPCTNECGKNGNGYKCNNCEAACNQANVYEKLYTEGEIDIPDTDRCATLWKNSCATACGPDGNRGQCERCEDDCGDRWTDQFPGQRTVNHRALCTGQGGEWDAGDMCCDCQGKRMSQVQCCSGTGYVAPKPRTPLRESPRTPGAQEPEDEESRQTDEDRPRSTGGGVGGRGKVVPNTPKSSSSGGTCPAASKCANGKCFQKCPNCKSQCNSPSTFDACCKAQSSYARSYLAGHSNRFGPGYTGRDNFADPMIMSRVWPSPDFEYLSAKKPYFLGPISPERAALNKRFFANMAITIA